MKKVVFSTIFSVLSVILYQKTVFFWGFFKYPKKLVPAAIGTLDFILSTKKCQDSQHVMSKMHEFWEYDFKIFSCFSKKVEKKWIFLTPPTYRKSEEKHKKMTFFLKNYKNHFPINNGWKLKKKNSKQIYQFHHCKYKNNRPHDCKYLLFFNDFTIYNGIFTDCSIFCVFYHLNLWEVSIFFRNGPMDF